MKILVLLKQTADTEAKISPSMDGKKVLDPEKKIINPYDENAIEEGLKIKGEKENVELVLLSFGPASSKEALLKGLAMGANRAVLVDNSSLEHCDSQVVAKILSTCIKEEKADLVLCGKQAIDDDNMHVGMMCAELLGWPHVNVISKLKLKEDTIEVERESEGGQKDSYTLTLPAICGTHKSLNKPRYASLPGIMKAKKKPFDLKTVGDLGLKQKELEEKNKTKIVGYRLPASKAKGKIFQDQTVDSMLTELVDHLRNEAKIL